MSFKALCVKKFQNNIDWKWKHSPESSQKKEAHQIGTFMVISLKIKSLQIDFSPFLCHLEEASYCIIQQLEISMVTWWEYKKHWEYNLLPIKYPNGFNFCSTLVHAIIYKFLFHNNLKKGGMRSIHKRFPMAFWGWRECIWDRYQQQQKAQKKVVRE